MHVRQPVGRVAGTRKVPLPAYSCSAFQRLIFANHAKVLDAIEGYHVAVITHRCDDNEQALVEEAAEKSVADEAGRLMQLIYLASAHLL
jgi:hypothetical protein